MHLALLVPWVGLVLGARRPIRDNSFLWHVAAGRLQVASGDVLTADPFSFTRPGQQWRTQSWLADLLYARLDEWWGIAYVPWLLIGVGAATTAVVAMNAWRASESLSSAAAIGVLSIWIGLSYLSPRPVLFSYLFIALVVSVLRRPGLRWALPLIIWIWASVHGSFVVGIGVVTLHAYSQRRFREGTALAAVLALVASVTAHGWGIWEMLLAFFRSSAALELITEWAPPDLTSLGLLPFVGGVFLVVIAAFRGRLGISDLWMSGAMLFFGVSASRSVFPAWLVLAPLVAKGIESTWVGRLATGGRMANAAMVPALILLPFAPKADVVIDPIRFPVEATVRCIEPGVRTFHDDVTGGYLIYAAFPEVKVFVDDRAELYGEELFKDTIDIRSGAVGWDQKLGAWNMRQVLVKADAPVVDNLELSGWHRRYLDDSWAVFNLDDRSPC